MRRKLIVCAVLAVLVGVVYFPSLQFEFIHLDDPAQVLHNPEINQGLSMDGMAWAFGINHWAYHPLTFVSHMIDCHLFGVEKPVNAGAYSLIGPGGHHLTNVLIHAANAVLLFLLLYRLTDSFWCSAAAAALFALHPLRVESVAWIAERKDVLSTFFGLGAILAYAHYAQKPSSGRYLLLCGLFVLSLLSKAMFVTLPFVLLLLDYWPLRRYCGLTPITGEMPSASEPIPDSIPDDADAPPGKAPEALEAFTQRSIKALVIEKLPLLGLSFCSIGMTLWAALSRHAVASLDSVTLGQRLTNVPISYVLYLKSMFWPVNLALLYPYQDAWPWTAVIGSLALLLLITALSLWQIRTRPFLLIGWLIFLGTLVPVIGLVQAGGQARADRFTYVPMIGIVIMAVWLIASLLERMPAKPRMAAVGASLASALICLMFLSHQQLSHWRNSERIYEHTLKVTENNWKAQSYLARWAMAQQQFPRASKHLKKILELKPGLDHIHHDYVRSMVASMQTDQALSDYRKWLGERPEDPVVHYGLALVLDSKGEHDQALQHYRQAVALDPQFVRGRYTLARHLWSVRSDQKAAEAELLRALEDDPLSSQTMHTLGALYMAQSRFEEADAILTGAVKTFPYDSIARLNLGHLRLKQKRHAEAIALYQKASAMNPNSVANSLALILALIEAGRYKDARAVIEKISRYRPEDAELHRTLATIYLRIGDLSASATHYQRRIELGPADADIHNALGVVYARMNRPDQAIVQFQSALKIDPDHAQATRNLRRLKQGGAVSN